MESASYHISQAEKNNQNSQVQVHFCPMHIAYIDHIYFPNSLSFLPENPQPPHNMSASTYLHIVSFCIFLTHGDQLVLPDGMLTDLAGLILYSLSPEGNPRWSEVIDAIATSYLEDSISQYSSLFSGSYILHIISSTVLLILSWVGYSVDIDVPFM